MNQVKRPFTKASVTQSFTHAIVQQLTQLGVTLPDKLRQQLTQQQGQQRLPLALQDELWQSLEQLQRPELGLQIGMALQPQHFDTIGFLLLSSPSLSTAVESLVNYSSLIGEGGTFSKAKSAQGWQVGYDDHFNVAVALRIEAIFASIARGAQWVAGKSIMPVQVHFKHPQQTAMALYQQAFGTADISFEQAHNTITYSEGDWSFRQQQVNPALQTQMLELAKQQLAQLQPQSLTERVEALLQRQPWLSRTQLATSLAVSERTLARHLAAAHTSYNALSQQVKKQLALQQVCQPQTTQSSLADFLGYSDEQAFAKAFRRWTGMSFSEFRLQHNKGN
ncbi:AraC family transcriptional regulator [Pseudidiomarina homiensis]|uniref:AraC family transcriptional regulator n=1 Tax=Pseudidiomarina homiensis TaxID=364198 RepID=A0A432Y3I9_9GAMM|nr:AraC family transcriptional regulator [Pseudidiomarina homiensis]RUO55539.1 AraC family transcriptional regulator [Pseudidiomarina homiensis]